MPPLLRRPFQRGNSSCVSNSCYIRFLVIPCKLNQKTHLILLVGYDFSQTCSLAPVYFRDGSLVPPKPWEGLLLHSFDFQFEGRGELDKVFVTKGLLFSIEIDMWFLETRQGFSLAVGKSPRERLSDKDKRPKYMKMF